MSDPVADNNRPSWDEYFMEICHVVAKRSKDPSTKNGGVIVNDKKVIVGMGYNGFPRGVDDDQLTWKREGEFCDTKYAYVVHAEENAVYNANASTDGCILYCTLFPCNECSKTIIQSGIKEVIYDSDKYHDQDIWRASRKLLDLAGVTYRQVVYKVDENNSSITELSEIKLPLNVKIKKVYPDAILPSYAYEGDAGMDLYAMETVEIPSGSRAKIGTGIAIELPEGYASLIWDKSGVSIKKGLKTIGGVVDAGYRGEYFVGVANISKESLVVSKGEKIAQLLIQKVEKVNFEVADELGNSQRGEKTLGSSDLKRIDPADDFGLEYLPEEGSPVDDLEADLTLKKKVNNEEIGEGQDEESRW